MNFCPIMMILKLRILYINSVSAWIILISLLRKGLTNPDSEASCRSDKFQSSCGECIKAQFDCSWCTDPEFGGTYRCDTFENLQKYNCLEQNIYKPKSKVEYIMDRPLRGGNTHLQPQRIQIVMKPGETVIFSLKYLHLNERSREIYILNSETESQGLQLSYVNDCQKKLTEGRSCSGAKISDVITYNVSVTLRKCVNEGDAVVSIGIGGLREVVALYVTPACGCECEKVEFLEARAPKCNGWGNLVCGSCMCLQGRTGKKCDCDSSDDKCKQSPGSLVCSGRGTCECGFCKCENPEILNGEFCECDITSCPIFDGIMCAGHGACDCGKCICDPGRTGQICECPISHDACMSDGKECSNNGICQCGKCICNEGFDGDLCEINEDEEYKAENALGAVGGGASAQLTTTSVPAQLENIGQPIVPTTPDVVNEEKFDNELAVDQDPDHDQADMGQMDDDTNIEPPSTTVTPNNGVLSKKIHSNTLIITALFVAVIYAKFG